MFLRQYNTDDGTRTRNPSKGAEFIQLVYCIIIHFSTVVDFSFEYYYWTQDFLVPAEKLTVRMLMMGLKLTTPRMRSQSHKLNSFLAIAFELFSSMARALGL